MDEGVSERHKKFQILSNVQLIKFINVSLLMQHNNYPIVHKGVDFSD
jgi:hypothetical protein